MAPLHLLKKEVHHGIQNPSTSDLDLPSFWVSLLSLRKGVKFYYAVLNPMSLGEYWQRAFSTVYIYIRNFIYSKIIYKKVITKKLSHQRQSVDLNGILTQINQV